MRELRGQSQVSETLVKIGTLPAGAKFLLPHARFDGTVVAHGVSGTRVTLTTCTRVTVISSGTEVLPVRPSIPSSLEDLL